jgi:hypothetical protein
MPEPVKPIRFVPPAVLTVAGAALLALGLPPGVGMGIVLVALAMLAYVAQTPVHKPRGGGNRRRRRRARRRERRTRRGRRGELRTERRLARERASRRAHRRALA